MIKLMIVDDHHLLRTGLRNIIEAAGGIEIVAEAATGEEAIRLNRDKQPDVILMDISLPGLSGFETSERIMTARSEVRIIALTAHNRPPYTTRMLSLGVAGYLTKACDAAELVEAIRKVHNGDRHFGSEITQQLVVSLLPGAEQSPFERLTPRELEVAMMMSAGHKPVAIGQRLNVSIKTVSSHKYNVYEKLGVDSEVGVLREAIRYGLVEAEMD
ncbi:MAG: two-component system response regulator UvrY [Gammaproteobacteria bacterium HGW-Gammaproteobacteria-8]|nr:MAG: two-component system response regulator UvrY [Gammaproteobacteria bacterium HGW-Gammaproteobacteria-8]